ncbi:hypothetical protein [Hymenobacter elongatus]|uniref:Uncharacterized protein n=1 Tax=Hymenobacter elongatus TaxID=877208 RepID=A0A4Z0PLX1_9BACT|nr:hypothetical protein [Hymenobacter elongatus]TGE17367.1 hypothetical protein E5J99_07320 [Hymenobacter elongatus]
MVQSLTEHLAAREWLAITPQLVVHCRFNPLYDVLDGYREEPLSTAECSHLTAYQQHCQRALKTLYDTLGALPADNLTIRSPHHVHHLFAGIRGARGRYRGPLQCEGTDPLQPLGR